MSFTRILISVDGEPVAVHAADVGIELATLLKAEIAFIHIVDPSLYRAPESGVPADEIISLAEHDGRRLLAGFRERMAQQSVSLEFLRVGKPAAEILKAAREWPADVIVIGSHGRRGVQRALLGSIAEGVMRHAPCPILVVRAKD